MDWNIILPNIITQLLVLIVGIPTLIIKVMELKHNYKIKEMENSKEETQKKVVIEMIRNKLIKIDPPDAEKLIINLLSGALDAEGAIKQLAISNELKEKEK